MAYDETSFLSGIVLGRAMKGVGMANPNRGNFLRVLSGRLAAVGIVPLHPEAVPGPAGGSVAVRSYSFGPVGQQIRAALLLPGDPGLGGIAAEGLLKPEEEIIRASAATTGERRGVFSAAIRRKAAEGSWRAEDMPNGMGGTVQASAVITTEE